ncbi:hypothetical protein [Motiliproteus sediminis]|uniref:hypothetical protein n=1 Tax=Motiliproteus sediminis TaxID=1468178 RepID=UPI001AEFA174|nr:hypothetical protein [Motiliproteus sediminis]
MLLFALVGGNLLLTLLMLSSRSSQGTPDAEMLTLFQRTIVDAERPTAARISDQLFPLTPDNPKLHWETRDGSRWVKVVTWQSNASVASNYGDDKKGEPQRVAGFNLWVTLAPQVKNFCNSLPRDIDPSFRLKQYLGLNPARRYERFVELLVRPEQVFRPCPDPDPSDRRCELQMAPDQTPRVSGIEDYRLWMAEMRRKSYQPDGAPWTRLGYTYDWQYGSWGVGGSEYILTPDATYYVLESYSTDEYCGYPVTAFADKGAKEVQ